MGKIVICGDGRIKRNLALRLLADHVQGMARRGDEDVTLIFPLLSDRDSSISAVVAQAARWGLAKAADGEKVNVRFIVNYVDKGQKVDPLFGELTAEVKEWFTSETPITTAISECDPKTDVVMVAWDEDDVDKVCNTAVETAHHLKVPALDLTDGLSPLEWEPDEDTTCAVSVPVQTALPMALEAPDAPLEAQEDDTLTEEQAEIAERLEAALVAVVDVLADMVLMAVRERLQ